MPKNDLEFTKNRIYKKGYRAVDAKFVKECDYEFEARLSLSVKAFAERKDLRVIGLTGPTCSGKTTAAKKLIEYLGDEQKRVHTISLDDFYKTHFSREALKGADLSKVDFDSPDTLDCDELERFVSSLFSTGVAKKPIFDFETGERREYEDIISDDDDVYIFEGIQVLYPSVRSIIESQGGSVLCVCPTSGLEIDGRKFDPNFIRLCRRLVRDNNFRASTAEFTFSVWNGVRNNEERNIFPYIDGCDVMIDTTLAYELNILAPYLRKMLAGIAPESEHYEYAAEILRLTDGIEGLDSSVIGKNSLYREFV